MVNLDPKLTELELEDLKVHVVASHERYKHLDGSVTRIEKLVEKSTAGLQEDMKEIKKLVYGTAMTLFVTMVGGFLSQFFGL